jgi:hypothetical protein
MSIPLYIFHLGNQSYFQKCVLINAKRNTVYIIGDDSNSLTFKDNPNVIHVHIDSFKDNKDIQRVRAIFDKHLITDPNEFSYYNLLWNLRVFYLKELIHITNIPTFFHIDSDCVVFENINKISFDSSVAYSVQTYSQQSNPYHMVGSIHVGLLNSEFCATFTELFFDIYENLSREHLVLPKRQWHTRAGQGSICDMTLYYIMFAEQLIKVDNLNDIREVDGEKCVFDHQITNPYGYLGECTYSVINGIKEILQENNKLYFKTVQGEKIRMLSIHCQGISKSILEGLDVNSM